MENKKNLISVIIPIYNAQKYLRQAIESVLVQSYPRFELILVNDGSTDKSLEICQEYQAKDKRIFLYSKQNEGNMKTRLYALTLCKGDYIAWVDADDWIIPNYLELLINKALEYDVDLVCIGSYKFLDKWKVIKTPMHCFEEKLYTSSMLEKYHKVYAERLFPNTVWGKLYKKELFEQCEIVALPIHWAEDLYINLSISPFIHSCYFINECGYYYRFGGSTKNYDERFWKNHVTLYWIQKEYAGKHYPEYTQQLKSHLIDIFRAQTELMIAFSSYDKEAIISFMDSVLNSSIGEEFISITHYNKDLNSLIHTKNTEKLYDYIKQNINQKIFIRNRVFSFIAKFLS